MEDAKADCNEQRKFIKTVIDKCRYEKQMGYLSKPLTDYHARAAYYTGRTQELIKEIDNKWIEMQNIVQVNHGNLVLKSFNALLLNKELPDYMNSYKEYVNQCKLKFVVPLNKNQYRDVLEVMGYSFKKLQNEKLILLENPRFTFERSSYLSKVMEYRKEYRKLFYYVGERLVDDILELKFPELLLQKLPSPTSNSSGCIFYYMISKIGYVSGLFCSESSNESFKQWLTEIALPEIKCDSIIIMNKNCHKKLMEPPITRYHSKKYMLEWLDTQQVPYSYSISKAELYELINKTTGTKRHSATCDYIKACGHQVLCVPSTLLELSLADRLWTFLKLSSPPSDTSIGSVKNWILSSIYKITSNEWTSQESELMQLEKSVNNIDLSIEELMEKQFELDEGQFTKNICDCDSFF